MKPSEVIRKYGWCRLALARGDDGRKIDARGLQMIADGEDFADGLGGVCAIGAMMVSRQKFDPAVLLHEGENGILQRMSKVVESERVNPMDRVSSWNDKFGRTEEEVIAAFEAIGE